MAPGSDPITAEVPKSQTGGQTVAERLDAMLDRQRLRPKSHRPSTQKLSVQKQEGQPQGAAKVVTQSANVSSGSATTQSIDGVEPPKNTDFNPHVTVQHRLKPRGGAWVTMEIRKSFLGESNLTQQSNPSDPKGTFFDALTSASVVDKFWRDKNL